MSDIQLPELVGTLAALEPHVQEAVKAYGAACVRVAIRAAWRAAQLAPGEWQPIETALKPDIGADGFGKRLLLVVDCGEGTAASVQKGYWEGTDWYLDSCIGLATSCGYRVTHWQPLPEPPAHSSGRSE